MGSRRTHEGSENVYAAAQEWVDRALRDDDSLFTPGKPIWSSRWLGELRKRFLDNPEGFKGNFTQKLEQQLAGSDPEVYQLMAEVLYAQFLIIWKGGMGGETKRSQVEQVLGWGARISTVPEHLVRGLTPGVAHSEAFLTYRPYQAGFIIEFVDQWKGQEPRERNRVLEDPWAFKDLVMGTRLDSLLLRNNQNTPRSQREALLHLVFPDTFEATVSVEQKNLIARAKPFAHFVTEETRDIDRNLAQIRRGLEAGLGRDFDFYTPDIRSWWDESQSGPWDAYLRLASDFLNTGRMQPWELGYKYEIGRKLAEGRRAVLNNAEDWQTLVKRGITGNIIHSTQQDNFRRWIDDSPDGALTALKAIWADDDSSVSERVQAFSREYPESVRSSTGGAGTRMNVVSQLLMGLDVEKYPPFMVTAFDGAYERIGYDKPAHYNEAALYVHALGFLDRFIDEARKRGLPVRHRLDAQSLVWTIPYQESETVRKELPTEETSPDPESLSLEALSGDLFLTTAFLEGIESLLKDKKQVIFQGPPGTGKTYVAQALAEHLAGSAERVTLVQLHPSYAYEDFVQGFRPTLRNGQPGFELRDGPLLRAAKRARDDQSGAKHFLVIDEINRGNLAKVLGELYFLLEYRDKKIRLQYHSDAEEDFSLPPNLYFIGTMNTADRSIALVDLALRRRFYFVEFHPDDEPVKGVLRRWIGENAPGMEWVADVVERANRLLQDDRHAAIGPSYFMKDGLDETAVERIWKHSVLSYIEERLFGDDDRIRPVRPGRAEDEERTWRCAKRARRGAGAATGGGRGRH